MLPIVTAHAYWYDDMYLDNVKCFYRAKFSFQLMIVCVIQIMQGKTSYPQLIEMTGVK